MARFTNGEPKAFPRTQGLIFDLIARRVRTALDKKGLHEYEIFGALSTVRDVREREKASIKPLASNIVNARITANNPYLIPSGRVADMVCALSMSSDELFWGTDDEAERYLSEFFKTLALDALDGAASDGFKAVLVDRMTEWSEYAVIRCLIESADRDWFEGQLTSNNFLLPSYESLQTTVDRSVEAAIARTFLSVRDDLAGSWLRFASGKTSWKLHRLLLSFVTDELGPMLERARDDSALGRLSYDVMDVILGSLSSEVEFSCGCYNEIPAYTLGSEEPIGDVKSELSELSDAYLDGLSNLQRRIEGDPLEREWY